MNKFYNKEDKILLLGEGNFSFARSLTNSGFKNITATGFTILKDVTTFENIDFLKSNGVAVYLDVDATKLEDHTLLKNESFQRIIFNFPHIGGKMHVGRNRDLLKAFFQSAVNRLSNGGKIVVALCKGQGGTPAELFPRPRQADSWQVVEMASQAGLVLQLVVPFPEDALISYTRVGYRSGVSPFHAQGSLIHVFEPRPLQFVSLTANESFGEKYYLDRISNNPMQFPQSIMNYFYLKFENNFKIQCENHNLTYEIVKNSKLYTNCLTDYFEINQMSKNISLITGFCSKKFDDNFNSPKITFEILILGSKSNEISKVILSELGLSDQLIKLGFNFSLMIFDNLIIEKYKLENWRQIWPSTVNSEGDIQLANLYPGEYQFDLTLRDTNNIWDQSKIIPILWTLAGDLIIKITFLPCYQSSKGWIGHTLRFNYQSFDRCLGKKQALEIHQRIGKNLCSLFGFTLG